MNLRSQDLKDSYFDVGQFYYANKKTWLNKNIFTKDSKIIPIPYLQSFDLNNMEDNLIKVEEKKGR